MRLHATIVSSCLMLGVVVANPFTLTAYLPHHKLHGQVVNVAAESLWLGLAGPASYCPSPPVTNCPPGDKSVFVGALSMWVEVPGGEMGYVEETGALKYTGPHSAFMPPGSIVGGFTARNVTHRRKNPQTLLNWEDEKTECGGIFACPTVPPYVKATHQLFAGTPKFNRTGCIMLKGLLEHQQPNNDFGAWEYT